MQYDESIIVCIVLSDDLHDFHPRVRSHLGGIHWGIELYCRDRIAQLLQLGHVLLQVLEVERLQHTCFRILDHADRSSCVDH